MVCCLCVFCDFMIVYMCGWIKQVSNGCRTSVHNVCNKCTNVHAYEKYLAHIQQVYDTCPSLRQVSKKCPSRNRKVSVFSKCVKKTDKCPTSLQQMPSKLNSVAQMLTKFKQRNQQLSNKCPGGNQLSLKFLGSRLFISE